jgi:hypothetical protein
MRVTGIMQGLLIFKTMDDAFAQGFQFFDTTKDGFLVRKKLQCAWALAIVRR